MGKVALNMKVLSAIKITEAAFPLLYAVAEGYWLKHIGHSPYAGSAYHGSPLLLAIFGPLTTSRAGGTPALKLSLSFLCVIADLAAAVLLVEIGRHLQFAQSKQFSFLGLTRLIKDEGRTNPGVGEIAAMFYLWNPFTILSCVGGCTSSIENAMIILSLYGAVTGNVPLAAFGWVIATHCSLYPAILLIPIGLSLTVGIDHPPKKLFKRANFCEPFTKESVSSSSLASGKRIVASCAEQDLSTETSFKFEATKLRDLMIWCTLWWAYVLILCKISVGKLGGLQKMFSETYGFILNVEELSPNLGLFWYFFTEVFDFFRPFFLLVFHANILFMILPLTIRLHHRPLFLAFVFCSIVAMLKAYPSVGDAALYLGLMPLFITELTGMRFTFFLLNGYIGVALLSPVMYNLWIWRGTGNANFYFAMALSYACVQLILLVESGTYKRKQTYYGSNVEHKFLKNIPSARGQPFEQVAGFAGSWCDCSLDRINLQHCIL
ncbi:hypothetical protein GOP47_0009410 [Adiantum capillus-veneris]|uniref:Phosphatidylinositol glycan anchor biosynthesis class U protein n=1 Tax=Adiantum capillus-veneris TaxID=13818 RepID=A0A9D4UWJ8_ADICA|nr:hypothetical protein GOP47_0009410 [Adiantum capillus-veneris]